MRRVAAGVTSLLALLPALACPGGARADRLVVSLSANEISIGSNYTGTQLVLFGIIERDSQSVSRADGWDVVVTLRGPREFLTVRQKEHVGPVWINRSQQKFAAVPSALLVLSSRPLGEIASPAVRARLQLGLDAVVGAPSSTSGREAMDDPFRAALVRLKGREGLWTMNEHGVTFVTDAFFRAPLPIPAIAPVGNYDVEVLVMSGGAVLSRRNASFEVVKTGFEEQITTFAQERALPYGAFIGFLSLAFGWLASIVFRRD